MPCLIPEFLFAIGRKLIEDSNSDAIAKFALSGKHQFQAMKNIFTSVSFLGFYDNHFAIGWGDQCFKFEYGCYKPPIKTLMNCVGEFIINLHIDGDILRFLQPTIYLIIDKKQLITFSAGTSCDTSFLDKFLPHFSSTLKHVSIPDKLMNPTFRDSLQLENLKVLFPFDYRLLHFCCKTTSLTISYKYSYNYSSNFLSEMSYICPAFSSIKRLIFEHEKFSSRFIDLCFAKFINYFSSLDILKFDLVLKFPIEISAPIKYYTSFINDVFNIPPKVVIEIALYKLTKNALNIFMCKNICKNFEYDETCSDFFCFRKNVQSRGPRSTILEVQIRFI